MNAATQTAQTKPSVSTTHLPYCAPANDERPASAQPACCARHTWLPLGHHGYGSQRVYRCRTCGVWGTTSAFRPSDIKPVKHGIEGLRRRFGFEPELTAQPVQPRNPAPDAEQTRVVDRRGDELPRKRGKGFYQARFVLGDWDSAPRGADHRFTTAY